MYFLTDCTYNVLHSPVLPQLLPGLPSLHPKKSSSICVPWLLLEVELALECGQPTETIPVKKTDPPPPCSSYQIRDPRLVARGSPCPPPHSVLGFLSTWSLHGSCACCHNQDEFTWTSALLCLENSVLGVTQHPTPYSNPALEGCCVCDPRRAKHSRTSSSRLID